ncbi:hypothetical protein G5V57_00770 [Nordella sp. HKS 07]|uniref:hypothetical protein n=1 Tax=Nordella sp. HKS 07 TaxID=2712222 RepID=UPI0013E193C8|nr:hypothetical protein [Nordella sp. HKS 07]QIG46416.1 hypothetical protein G5V57_00770 [Nordella sp. HKS 07]
MIRKRAWLSGVALTGTVAITAFGGTAFAADVSAPECAVSSVNGKIEAGGGYADMKDENGDFAWEAGGSLSFPLGCMFGFQADLGVTDRFGDTQFGGIGHFFARDPESYLIGIAGGAVDGDDATLYAVGPEAELYLGNFSLEAWGGYVNVDRDDGDGKDSGFLIGDAAYYITDDFRVSVGGRIIDDYEGVRAGFEYQFGGMPMSLYSNAEYGDNDYLAVLGGLKFYFGGEDKTLIRRHREDDPRNRALDLFFKSGNGDNDSGGYGGGGEEPPPT